MNVLVAMKINDEREKAIEISKSIDTSNTIGYSGAKIFAGRHRGRKRYKRADYKDIEFSTGTPLYTVTHKNQDVEHIYYENPNTGEKESHIKHPDGTESKVFKSDDHTYRYFSDNEVSYVTHSHNSNGFGSENIKIVENQKDANEAKKRNPNTQVIVNPSIRESNTQNITKYEKNIPAPYSPEFLANPENKLKILSEYNPGVTFYQIGNNQIQSATSESMSVPTISIIQNQETKKANEAKKRNPNTQVIVNPSIRESNTQNITKYEKNIPAPYSPEFLANPENKLKILSEYNPGVTFYQIGNNQIQSATSESMSVPTISIIQNQETKEATKNTENIISNARKDEERAKKLEHITIEPSPPNSLTDLLTGNIEAAKKLEHITIEPSPPNSLTDLLTGNIEAAKKLEHITIEPSPPNSLTDLLTGNYGEFGYSNNIFRQFYDFSNLNPSFPNQYFIEVAQTGLSGVFTGLRYIDDKFKQQQIKKLVSGKKDIFSPFTDAIAYARIDSENQVDGDFSQGRKILNVHVPQEYFQDSELKIYGGNQGVRDFSKDGNYVSNIFKGLTEDLYDVNAKILGGIDFFKDPLVGAISNIPLISQPLTNVTNFAAGVVKGGTTGITGMVATVPEIFEATIKYSPYFLDSRVENKSDSLIDLFSGEIANISETFSGMLKGLQESDLNYEDMGSATGMLTSGFAVKPSASILKNRVVLPAKFHIDAHKTSKLFKQQSFKTEADAAKFFSDYYNYPVEPKDIKNMIIKDKDNFKIRDLQKMIVDETAVLQGTNIGHGVRQGKDFITSLATTDKDLFHLEKHWANAKKFIEENTDIHGKIHVDSKVDYLNQIRKLFGDISLEQAEEGLKSTNKYLTNTKAHTSPDIYITNAGTSELDGLYTGMFGHGARRFLRIDKESKYGFSLELPKFEWKKIPSVNQIIIPSENVAELSTKIKTPIGIADVGIGLYAFGEPNFVDGMRRGVMQKIRRFDKFQKNVVDQLNERGIIAVQTPKSIHNLRRGTRYEHEIVIQKDTPIMRDATLPGYSIINGNYVSVGTYTPIGLKDVPDIDINIPKNIRQQPNIPNKPDPKPIPSDNHKHPRKLPKIDASYDDKPIVYYQDLIPTTTLATTSIIYNDLNNPYSPTPDIPYPPIISVPDNPYVPTPPKPTPNPYPPIISVPDNPYVPTPPKPTPNPYPPIISVPDNPYVPTPPTPETPYPPYSPIPETPYPPYSPIPETPYPPYPPIPVTPNPPIQKHPRKKEFPRIEWNHFVTPELKTRKRKTDRQMRENTIMSPFKFMGIVPTTKKKVTTRKTSVKKPTTKKKVTTRKTPVKRSTTKR